MLFIAPEIPAGLKLDYDIIAGTVFAVSQNHAWATLELFKPVFLLRSK